MDKAKTDEGRVEDDDFCLGKRRRKRMRRRMGRRE